MKGTPVSVSARLARMNLLVSFFVLLVASVSFVTYDLISYRANLIASLQAESTIIGDGAVYSLRSGDAYGAQLMLESLNDAPDVAGGTIRRADGELFARWGDITPHRFAQHQLAAGEANHWWYATNNHISFAHRITAGGQDLGTVFVVASLDDFHARVRRYILIALSILALSMVAGLGIAQLAQRWLSRPLTQLAETARNVTLHRDYTLRAEAQTNLTEIITLTNAFNAMLGQIQVRDRALLTGRDELEQRVADRTSALRAANRELEAFSYTVAHDLRNPLDALSGIVFLLQSSPTLAADEIQREMLEQMRKSVGNMSDLIEDLLNFARASSGELKHEPVDMSAIAREIVEELHRLSPERDVHFVVHNLAPVMGDTGLVRVVLDNLLRNAWKYSSHHAKATIEFGGKVVGDGMIYFVRDDGAGFDGAHADMLFRPFQRLHSKGEFPGTGIGLATVQRILQRMGGRIWAEGVVEVGAAFYFTLGK